MMTEIFKLCKLRILKFEKEIKGKKVGGMEKITSKALFSHQSEKKMSLKKLVHFCISPSSALLDLTSFI